MNNYSEIKEESDYEELERCSLSKCFVSEHAFLSCTKCHRKVHLECSLLPAYQIQLVLTKEIKFICNNCVLVPAYVRNLKNINEIKQSNKKLTIQTNTNNDTMEKLVKMVSEIKTQLKEQKKDIEENKTYAEAARKPNGEFNIANIIRKTKEEERNEELEVNKREKGIVIYNVQESRKMDEKRLKKYDEEYVDILLKTIKIKTVRPKYITRIGQSNQKRFRPMKVVFSSKEDKEKVFENIKQIKGNPRYENISITEDFTINERKLIKEWVEKSKEKNKDLPST